MASTHEIHRADHTLFTEPYRESRRNRDYSYHSNYTLARQDLQDSIIARFLGGIARPDSEGSDSPVGAPKPWILFTSGGPGVGKTTAVQWMYDSGLLPLQRFVVVDPDSIRYALPEWKPFAADDPLSAGDRTQREAGFIAELIQEEALRQSRCVLVDGTLRNVSWYAQVIQALRLKHPAHSIAILLVTSAPEVALRRISRRAAATGRGVPASLVEESLAQVPVAFAKLAPLADFSAEVVNDSDGEPPELRPPVTWVHVHDAFTPRQGIDSVATPDADLLRVGSVGSPRETPSATITSSPREPQSPSLCVLRSFVLSHRKSFHPPDRDRSTRSLARVLQTAAEHESAGLCSWSGLFKALVVKACEKVCVAPQLPLCSRAPSAAETRAAAPPPPVEVAATAESPPLGVATAQCGEA